MSESMCVCEIDDKTRLDLSAYHVILFTVHRAIDIVEVLVSQGASYRERNVKSAYLDTAFGKDPIGRRYSNRHRGAWCLSGTHHRTRM